MEDRQVEGAYQDAANSLAHVGGDAGAVQGGLDDHRPDMPQLVGAERVLGLVGVEDPADVGAVVAQGLRAVVRLRLLHLLEPEVEKILNGVVGRERAIAEGAGVLDEERLEVGLRLGLGLTVLAVLPHDTVDVAVAGARLPRPALQPEAADLAVGADHQSSAWPLLSFVRQASCPGRSAREQHLARDWHGGGYGQPRETGLRRCPGPPRRTPHGHSAIGRAPRGGT